MSSSSITIVGLAARTPKGDGLCDLWEGLMEYDSNIRTVCYGKESTPFGYASIMPSDIRDGFDPKFWGLNPVQASEIDPQTRWIMEGVWNAMLDTDFLSRESLAQKRVGVYCGIMNNDAQEVRHAASMDFALNSAPGSVAGFVSHAFGFRGPSGDVNTMCSSGLVCLEMATESLRSGACDVAFVAAANWVGGPTTFQHIESLNALSKSGIQDCLGRVPDGYIRGEACVVLALQRLTDLPAGVSPRGIVEAVARGGMSPNNGSMSTNVAEPTPSSYINSYEKCLQTETSLAKDDVVYVEMHATGTVRGDKAEIDSVVDFFGLGRGVENREAKVLWLGGNKSIFGHTEPVSGLLSIAKILLAFEHGVMPPTLFMTDPTSVLEEVRQTKKIELAMTPLPMDTIADGLYAVTASGMSGITAHAIIRPPVASDLQNQETSGSKNQLCPPILTLSTHSAGSCKKWRDSIANEWADEVLIQDARLPKMGSLHLGKQAAASCTLISFDEMALSMHQLRSLPIIRNPPDVLAPTVQVAGIILGFGGIGLVQYGVGRRAYAEWPSFRDAVNKVDQLFQCCDVALFRNRSVAQLCGMILDGNGDEKDRPSLGSELPTELMQATTFLVQYAEAEAIIRDFNVNVDGVIGHSFGETVAGVVSGAITLKSGVMLTALRTQVCLEIEQQNGAIMAMYLAMGVSYGEITAALEEIACRDGIHVTGIIAEKEFLLSGTRQALEEFTSSLTSEFGATIMRVESTVAFHSPLVAEVGSRVETLVEHLIEKQQLFEQGDAGQVKCFMTSSGGETPLHKMRSALFWKTSVMGKVLLKDVISDVEAKLGNLTTPIIDLSPRGLYVNWFRRNGSPHGLSMKIVSAPTFSWDIFRVLQHFRKCCPKREIIHELERGKTIPAYPFTKQICTDIPQDYLVRTVGDTDTKKPATTVFNRKTCLETVYKDIDVHSLAETIDPLTCVGINLVSDGTLLWNALWGLEDQRRRVITKFTDANSFLEHPIWKNSAGIKLHLLVCGPLHNSKPNPGFEDALDMTKALEFVDGLQELVFQEDSPLVGLLFVTGDPSHPSFEFCAGSFASLRLQASTLNFVSTLRVSQKEPSDDQYNGQTMRGMLNAAASGEVLMELVGSKGLKGCRLVPARNTMSWQNFDWVKADCCYVVSGSAGSMAMTLLPFLASVGVKHFLLLFNRRQPSPGLVGILYRLGAKSVLIKRCRLDNETAITDVVKSALDESGSNRVAGCFHLAGIDSPKIRLPVPKEDIERILDVKYKAHITLLNALKLHRGDIFSVPGSFSTIMGSGGIGYAATNHACRALQLRIASHLIAPYPSIAVSHNSFYNTTLMAAEKYSEKALRNLNGLEFVSSQTFNLGLTSSLAIPSASRDLAFIRMKTSTMHEYLNTTSPNLLCEDLLTIEEQEKISPISSLIAAQTQREIISAGQGTNTLTEPSKLHAHASVEDALTDAIVKVTGLSEDEVKSIARSDAFFEETYSIDSLSSVRLVRRIQELGFSVRMEAIVSGTYGDVLEQMKESGPPPQSQSSLPVVEAMEDPQPRRPASKQSTETSEYGFRINEQEIPVPVSLMKMVGQGHTTLKSSIVPSGWFVMVGSMICLSSNVKMHLFRMTDLEESFDWKFMKKVKEIGPTTVTFLAASGSQHEPVARAQLSTTNEKLEAVHSLRQESKSIPLVQFDQESIYGRLVRLCGFAYKGKYQSLRSIKIFGVVDPGNDENFLCNCAVEAEGHVELSNDHQMGRAEAVMIILDAALQAPSIPAGTFFAPAKLVVNMDVSVDEIERLTRHTKGKFAISSIYSSASPAGKSIGLKSTVRINGTPVLTVEFICKATPVAVGAKLYPQFFARPPAHTLVCFHMAGGTSRSFDELADLVAPHRVRVLAVDFSRHGRRTQQTDDDLVVTVKQMQDDLAPWIIQALQEGDGRKVPFSLVGVSAGGVCAYEMIHSCLLPAGLTPEALIVVLSQPPFLPNVHVGRTFDATVENISQILAYYSVLCNCDLSSLDEEEDAAAQTRSVLSVMHEITVSAGGSPHIRPKIDVPVYAVGLESDTVVAYEDVQRWEEAVSKSAWRRGGFLALSSAKEYHHFLSLTGKAGEAFTEILLENGVLKDIIS